MENVIPRPNRNWNQKSSYKNAAVKFQNEGESCGRMVSIVQNNSLILRYELDLTLGKIRKNIDVLNLLPTRSIADHDLERSRLASIGSSS